MKKSESSVTQTFTQIPELLERDSALIQRGRFLDVDCLLGSTETSFHISIRGGPHHRYGAGANPDALVAFRLSRDAAGVGRVLGADADGGVARSAFVDQAQGGNTRRRHSAFMTNLQYFKDLLALPRSSGGAR